jgi:hypothetical protein
MDTLLTIIVILIALIFLFWLGLKIQPRPFQPFSQRTPKLNTAPLPAGLPAPVERFFKKVYGDQVPLVESAVIIGRASIRPMISGPALPARFVFVHNAGKDYRHYIEATFFGLLILRVNEGYLDGQSFFESPMGTYYDDPSTNQGANLALWAEAGWFPSLWITDPRLRWEPIDEVTALLWVPFEDKMENFVVRFDPQTGLVDTMEAMRCRDAGGQAEKILWITKNIPGKTIEGTQISAVGSATWLDQGKPWAIFRMEDVVYNVDVSQYIRQRGI